MDPEIRDLVARKLQTTLKIDVVRFFVNAFSPLSTAAGVSLWLGTSEETLSPALEELVRDGLLTRSGEGKAAVFAVPPEVKGSEAITRLLDMYDDEMQRGEVLAALSG
jgi:hypothetical protein